MTGRALKNVRLEVVAICLPECLTLSADSSSGLKFVYIKAFYRLKVVRKEH